MEIKKQDLLNHKTKWFITKFENDEAVKMNKHYAKVPFDNNILVNGGINELWKLATGTGGVKFDSINANIGVGDSNTAESASQTDLQAVTNKLRKSMNGGFPTYGTSQKVTFQADFTSAEANFHWYEFAVFNDPTAGTMLNRKVSDQGTKTAGQTWRVSVEITLS
jgi:hypothetical protein